MERHWSLDQAIVVDDVEQLVPALLKMRRLTPQNIHHLIEPEYSYLAQWWKELPDVQLAAKHLQRAIKKKQRIIVYGDYDIDGLTATSLLTEGLRRGGASVEAYIPDRFEEGYGLNSTALTQLKQNGTDLVITVDCGITSTTEIATAAQAGLDIIVTDHHALPDVLPKAAIALVNPKRLASDHPLYQIAGVGVAFGLISVLQETGVLSLPAGQEKWWLDLVALGTLCDVVPLGEVNWLLSRFGLMVMRQTRRPGLHALAEVSRVDISHITAEEVGFRFGPRLNAAGRIEHAKKALDLLLSDDRNHTAKLAGQLDELNYTRQHSTESIYQAALAKEAEIMNDPVAVLWSADWSHGVVGIVASRLMERWGKPVILLQVLGDTAKGSARSIPTVNIVEVIASQADLLERYGGHAFAAGMTINTTRLDDFRKRLNAFVQSQNYRSYSPQLVIELQITEELLDETTVQQLARLEPFGNGHLEPIVMSTLMVQNFRPVGRDQRHLQITFRLSNGRTISGIAFGGAQNWPWLMANILVEVAFRLRLNEWRGIVTPQLMIEDIRRPNDTKTPTLPPVKG